jgi:hypothetical protein
MERGGTAAGVADLARQSGRPAGAGMAAGAVECCDIIGDKLPYRAEIL